MQVSAQVFLEARRAGGDASSQRALASFRARSASLTYNLARCDGKNSGEERNVMDLFYKRLARAFWFTLATLFLIESWLWDHVKEWLRALALALGLKRIEAWLAAVVDGLSPTATLFVFALPALLILPFKLIAVALIVSGHIALGVATILAAKTLGVGVTAFLFDLCRDKLLELRWFASFYRLMLRIRAWAHDLVEPARRKLRLLREALRQGLAPYLGAGRRIFQRRLELMRALARRGGKGAWRRF
jgi:hypothetical protein